MSEPWNKTCDQCQSVPSDYDCPISNCSTHKKKKTIHWVHRNCGGGFRLYENGKEKCQRCGVEDYFCKWSYSCQKDNKSQGLSYSKIKSILQALVGMDGSDASPLFFLNIKACIENQRQKFPNYFTE